MPTVAMSWKVIEDVLRENANSVFRSLRKPASSASLGRLAADLPRKLPGTFSNRCRSTTDWMIPTSGR